MRPIRQGRRGGGSSIFELNRWTQCAAARGKESASVRADSFFSYWRGTVRTRSQAAWMGATPHRFSPIPKLIYNHGTQIVSSPSNLSLYGSRKNRNLSFQHAIEPHFNAVITLLAEFNIAKIPNVEMRMGGTAILN